MQNVTQESTDRTIVVSYFSSSVLNSSDILVHPWHGSYGILVLLMAASVNSLYNQLIS